jgi:glycosyltransferase involved in cell wall biosynthesis
MKLIFLSKRRPQGKDLLTRPYGRVFHIPRLRAERGHEVILLLLDYGKGPAVESEQFGMRRLSRSMWGKGADSYWATANLLARKEHPDWIIGCSDTYFGIMAETLAKRSRCRSVIDAYDNYESYLPWCTPLHHFWRRALAGATVVTAAGPQLAELLQRSRPGRPVQIVPMASDSGLFGPRNRRDCRRVLNLPEEGLMIGYYGSIHRSRGLDALFIAHERLRSDGYNQMLLLSGKKQRGFSIPGSVRWLGYLPDEQMPIFLNSLDVAVVMNRISAFGLYSYPVKLYEAMTCMVPVVASDTPPINWILKGDNRFLANPDNPQDLAAKIKEALKLDRIDYGNQSNWDESCQALADALCFKV